MQRIPLSISGCLGIRFSLKNNSCVHYQQQHDAAINMKSKNNQFALFIRQNHFLTCTYTKHNTYNRHGYKILYTIFCGNSSRTLNVAIKQAHRLCAASRELWFPLFWLYVPTYVRINCVLWWRIKLSSL